MEALVIGNVVHAAQAEDSAIGIDDRAGVEGVVFGLLVQVGNDDHAQFLRQRAQSISYCPRNRLS